ncbi:MAG: hypothetical protein RLZZ312_1095 [Bacteroidota bacterium]|jgi:nucleotide-binding universal stress UspA family protein
MKVVVTTDFSDNSKKGILFALQLSKQTNCELVFYHVIQLYQPAIWDNVYYNVYQQDEVGRATKTLENFVHAILLEKNIDNIDYSCVCEIGVSNSNQIIEFAKTQNAKYLCLSTSGGGKILQILGTTASELIAFSPIPVFVIPQYYNPSFIKKIFFASDFKNFESELHTIKSFSDTINAKIDVFHFEYKKILDGEQHDFEVLKNKFSSSDVKFHLRSLTSDETMLKQIESEIFEQNPSLVVMFTKQNRNWFDRLFLSSLSTELALDDNAPFLIFKKDEA